MAKMVNSSAKSEPIQFKYYRLLLVGLALLVISGALSIAFVYESQTLWYKIGRDKIILRAGQMAGLLTAVLLFMQILLAARGKLLQRLFGIAALMRWHRGNGIGIFLLATCHVLLVLIPEGLTNLPIGLKYWPEMVGMLLFCMIVAMVISALWRKQLRLNYQRWLIVHKLSGYLVVAFVALHVLFVSDSFEHTVPRTALFACLVGMVLAVIVSKIPAKLPKV